MKKKLTVVVASVAMVALIGLGGTLAWFTDKEEAQNIVTTGNVNIELTEPNFVVADAVKDLTPGQVIVKDPTIKNVGNNDAYIRATIAFSGATLTADQQKALVDSMNIDTNIWQQAADGSYTYYYKANDGVLTPAADAIKLFEKVTIPNSWGNEAAKLTFNIDVKADALQVANNPLGDKNVETIWTGVTAEKATK